MPDRPPPDILPRDPAQVMRLARMGSSHPHRLSFLRILLRRLRADRWRFTRPRFAFDGRGVGAATYIAHGPDRAYSLVAFGHDLAPENRSDRVIATAWDVTFALFDGIPGDDDIARLARELPLQEAGRVTGRELSVGRANRSVRLWDHVVERLAAGRQPEPARVDEVGYLMRTTAVYGSGKLGAADREAVCGRPEFQPPFQVEMLCVYLVRAFVMDLVEHVARMRAPGLAVRLDPTLRRRFGIGNSTGLGMAPFLLNHPVLLNNWIVAREEALARIRRLPRATDATRRRFARSVAGAIANAAAWRSDHPVQTRKLAALRDDLGRLERHAGRGVLNGPQPWNALWLWAGDALSVEGQEQLVSLMMEPHGAQVDGLAGRMAADGEDHARIDGAMPLVRLRAILRFVYGWALDIDWDAPDATARVWYVSAEKLEPRLGERSRENLGAFEQPLCPGRDAARLMADLDRAGEGDVAGLLGRLPGHRHIVRRAQIADRFPYAEIRDNTIAAGMLPIDLLRAKLAFFGAGRFDPRSDRWVRINLFQDAPFPDELAQAAPGDQAPGAPLAAE